VLAWLSIATIGKVIAKSWTVQRLAGNSAPARRVSVWRAAGFHAVVESFRFAAGGGERRLALAIRSIAAQRVGRFVFRRRWDGSRFTRRWSDSTINRLGRVWTRRRASRQKNQCNSYYFLHAEVSLAVIVRARRAPRVNCEWFLVGLLVAKFDTSGYRLPPV
jgi:hypothetical protein